MNNNETNEKKKKKKLLIWIIVGVVIAAVLVLIILALTKKEEPIGSWNMFKSGIMTAPEVPAKEAKTEAESKKDASSGKDDKTDEKSDSKQSSNTTGNSTSNANNQQGQKDNKQSGTNTSGGSTTGTGTQGGNTPGSNTSGGGNTPASHTHSWQAVYKTVTHPAVTEEVWVEDEAAWDEPQYAYHTVCFTCGLDYDAAGMTNDDCYLHEKAHRLAGEGDQSGTQQVQVGSIHHDATGHYEMQIVSQAWTEQVLDHYECSCGAIK
ncbi:MAG: hypothetical protein MJ086_01825 [Lachnospiraceae bacterium]|nr:hypothetical protein [Lachnospiraceae bacterium]